MVRTGFDLKLPVNATLTGELRLLYRGELQRRSGGFRAPPSGCFARAGGRPSTSGGRRFGLSFGAHAVAPFERDHRSPVQAKAGKSSYRRSISGRTTRGARALLQSADVARIEEFFNRYCRALMEGPVQFCSQWGMAFEPHLQNVYVAIRDGLPSRIVLRTWTLPCSIRNAFGLPYATWALELPESTWRHAGFEIGGKRLVQAMLFGHLGEVMWCLTQRDGIGSEKLVSIVEDTWSDLVARAPSAAARKSVKELRGWSDAVKATLHTRLTRSTTMKFIRE
jgi:siderophore synthetase component